MTIRLSATDFFQVELSLQILLVYNGARASLVAQVVRICLPMQETQVQSLGWEDSLVKEMATHSILSWEIPWTEEPGRLQSP